MRHQPVNGELQGLQGRLHRRYERMSRQREAARLRLPCANASVVEGLIKRYV